MQNIGYIIDELLRNPICKIRVIHWVRYQPFEQPGPGILRYSVTIRIGFTMMVRAATNESQKTRNKKQNGLAHLRFLVCVTPKQKRTYLDSRIKFLAKHV